MANFRGFYEGVLKYLANSPFNGKISVGVYNGASVVFDLGRLTVEFEETRNTLESEQESTLTNILREKVAEEFRLRPIFGVGFAYRETSPQTPEEKLKVYDTLGKAAERYFELRHFGIFSTLESELKNLSINSEKANSKRIKERLDELVKKKE